MDAPVYRSGWETFKTLAGVAILIVGGVMFSSAVRGESSPWVWIALANRGAGPVERALLVAGYAALYVSGFIVPYGIALLAVARTGRPSPAQRRACAFVGLAGLACFLTFLGPLIAFTRAIPSHGWAGGLVLLGVAATVIFGFMAAVELRSIAPATEPERPTKVPHDVMLAARDN
ncbi:MAG TPA: hypothetical protein VN613_07675 [Gemmatimonadaceae bacterium]|nr:hypothetical protein [Gemmatimonadaceae bacterium]